MSRSRITLAAVAAVAAMVVAPAAASAKPIITISGSTSVAPLTSKLLKSFLTTSAGKNKATFKVFQGGSDVGIADVSAGRVTIGQSSRDLKSSDAGGLTWNKIARDALCVAVNNSNGVSNLTTAQVQGIFGGTIRNWSDVAGSGKTGSINLYVRTAASGTQDAFGKLFMGTTSVTSSAAQKASNGLVQSSIQSDPNGIGYVSFDFLGGIKATQYQGVACSLTNAKSGAYSAVRNFWMVTRGAPTGVAATFISWIQTSSAAKKIIAAGWVPLV
ncbi:MAG: phosphate ABC transporter substrate-binding protein [Solirubrobacterales bacterium]|nr:phosphate ABC transporter substrate-binding protein [Solirubrobacterales bacterium]